MFLGFALLLLLNYLGAHAALKGGPTRIYIPYSPTFLAQVRAGNVEDIKTTDTAIQGGFRKAVQYPARSGSPRSRLFDTDVPAFANTDELSKPARVPRRGRSRIRSG